jgi:hypothetical protein
MSNLKVSGSLIVDKFYKKYEAVYPYLNPALFYPQSIGGREVDTSATIGKARGRSGSQNRKGYTATGAADISVTPNTTIKQFKVVLEKHFSVVCVLHSRPAPEFKWTAVGAAKYKDMTLGEANSQSEKNRAQQVGAVRTKGRNLWRQCP